jgi:hypothetical protein
MNLLNLGSPKIDLHYSVDCGSFLEKPELQKLDIVDLRNQITEKNPLYIFLPAIKICLANSMIIWVYFVFGAIVEFPRYDRPPGQLI